MGAPITIPVRWDDTAGAPTANDTTVGIRHGATVLQWEGDDSIGSITGITGLPNDEFTIPQKGSPKRWTATDKCTKTGLWKYGIAATNVDGTEGKSDPMIRNE